MDPQSILLKKSIPTVLDLKSQYCTNIERLVLTLKH